MCRGTERCLFFCYTFLLFADRTAQRDHAWITLLSQRLIKGLNEKVEHVVRNGDPNGYPGCVNLSFAYVEGESLLMALKVGESGMLS
jgi:cysteine sulfinate desulfinase/cysteine desulfurase-like protein